MKIYSVFIVSLFLCACNEHNKNVSESDFTDLDLSKIQEVSYFEKHLASAKKLNEWCLKNIPTGEVKSDEKSQIRAYNCVAAGQALANKM